MIQDKPLPQPKQEIRPNPQPESIPMRNVPRAALRSALGYPVNAPSGREERWIASQNAQKARLGFAPKGPQHASPGQAQRRNGAMASVLYQTLSEVCNFAFIKSGCGEVTNFAEQKKGWGMGAFLLFN